MRPHGDWQTGLLNADGTPKPGYHEYRTPTFAACRRSGKRRWIEVWGYVRGAQEPSSAQLQVRARGAVTAAAADGWRTVLSGTRPRVAGARAAQAEQPSPGAAVTRFIPWRRGLQVRLQWNGEGAQGSTGAALTPTICPAARRARSARRR